MSAFPTVLTFNQKSWSILLLDLIFCGSLQFQLSTYIQWPHLFGTAWILLLRAHLDLLISNPEVYWLVSIVFLLCLDGICSHPFSCDSNTGDARSHLEVLVTLLPCLVREVGFHANVWLLVSSVLLVHSAVFYSSSSRSQNCHLIEMHVHELWRQ